MQSINFGSVTKSWRSSPTNKHCNSPHQSQPWLSVSDESDQNDTKKIIRNDVNVEPQFCNMSFPGDWYFRSWYRKMPRLLYPWKNFTTCCHGHLVARSETRSQLYVFDPVRDTWWDFFEFNDGVPFSCVALSSSPSSQSCIVMVATGISCSAFMFYILVGKPYSLDWIRLDCTLLDPCDNHYSNRKFDQKQRYMRFTNAIGVKGKFYALSSQGTLVVIDEVAIDSENIQRRFEITGVSKARIVPSSVPSKGFRECLIESDGEILLVFLVYRKTSHVVDDVEVFGLCFDEISWSKMKSLGGRTLFLGSDCCISVCADKVGCKGNCVYFLQQGVVDGWWEYDMDVGSMSPVWTDHIGNFSTKKSLEWDEPIVDQDDRT